MASGVVGAFTEIITGARNAVNFLRWAGEEAAAFMNGIASDDVVRLQQELERLEDMKNSGVLDRTILFGRDGLIEYYDDAELDAEMDKIRAAIETAMMDVPKLETTPPPELLTPPKTDLGGGSSSGGTGGGSGAIAEVEAIQSQVDAMGEYMDLVERVGSVVQASWSDQSRALYEYQMQVETLREGLLGGVLSEDQYNATLEALEARNDLFSEKNAELLALTQEHEASMRDLEKAGQVAQLEGIASLFGDMAGLAQVFAGEQSAAYKALFASEKAYSIASTLVQSFPAIAKAWASAPFPANIPAVAITTAETGALQAAAQAVSLSGMAHDGIDSVPADGSWYLQKGERVTTAETSAKLDGVLADIQAGKAERSSGGNHTFHVDLSGIKDSREARRAEASVSRGIMQALNRAGRYS